MADETRQAPQIRRACCMHKHVTESAPKFIWVTQKVPATLGPAPLHACHHNVRCSPCRRSSSEIFHWSFSQAANGPHTQGMHDEQLKHLTRILERKHIWALNVGENFEINLATWVEFTAKLPNTAVGYLYVSLAKITGYCCIMFRFRAFTSRIGTACSQLLSR